MAVDTNAMSLATWAKMSNDPLIQKITKSLYTNESVLKNIPFINRKSMKASGSRWDGASGSLPTINWSKVNAAPVVTTGTPAQYQESAWLIRNFIDVDHVLRDDINSITDPVAQQVSAYMTALTYEINDKFINNDHVSGNSDAVIGIKFRLDNAAAFGIPTEMKIDGANDLRLSALTQATALAFFEKIDQLLTLMKQPQGDGVVLYMDEALYWRISSAAKTAGGGAGLDTTKDEYDRSITTYKNAKLQVIGRKADQTTHIITATESNTGTGTSSTYTSLYGVNWGLESAFGWQWDTMAAKPFGPTDDAVIDRTLLEYIFGLFFQDTRAVGRIYDIRMS